MKPKIWLYWDNYPGKSTPTYIQLCWRSIERHCGHDFDIVILNSDNIRQYLPNIRDDFFQLSQINNKSNYLRYKLLSEYGGVWLDSDMIILQNLLPLMNYLGEDIDLVATASPEYGYGEPECGFIISAKNGKVITKALSLIDKKIDEAPVANVFPWGTMGPAILRQAVKTEKYCHLPCKLLMPIGWQHAHKFERIDVIQKYLTTDTFAFMLYNEMFRRGNSEIMTMSEHELLNGKLLINQIFKRALID